MPRLLAKMGLLPDGEMYNALYEGIELATCLWLVESGTLDEVTDNKMLQIGGVSTAYVYYDRYIVPNQ